MKKVRFSTTAVGLAFLVLGAGSPAAMRVDVQSLPVPGDLTTLVVAAEIAPEDRGRFGTHARMRIRLFDGDTVFLHKLVDVDVDDQGKTQARIEAPTGTHELEVELAAVRGDTTGFWRGTIAVPRVGEGETPSPLPAGAPTVQAVTEQEPPPTPEAAEFSAQETVPEPVPAPEGTDPVVAATVVATTDAAVQTATANGNSQTEDPPTQELAAHEPETATVAAAAPAIVASIDQTTPEELTSAETDVASTSTRTSTAPPSPAPSPPPDPQPSDASVVINSPRAATPTPTVAPPPLLHEAPVKFLVALDVADENLGRAAAIHQHFLNVAEREGFAAIEIVPRPNASASALESLAGALDTVAQPPDGATLVLVTDGRQSQTRTDWKAADAAILQAGAPLLAVGLWNDVFNAGSRKNLSRIAVYSGGRFYLLQPGESTASVIEFFQLD